MAASAGLPSYYRRPAGLIFLHHHTRSDGVAALLSRDFLQIFCCCSTFGPLSRSPRAETLVITSGAPVVAGLWIRIGSGYFVDPDPYLESGSGGKKTKKFQWKNALFSYFFKQILPLKRYKIALTTF
jgi:hypothetical protein